MLSFITLAVGLLAITRPAFAQEVQLDTALAARDLDFTSEVFAEDGLAKRWHNHGKKCSRNSACRTDVKFARPSCTINGYCSFKCLGGTVRRGNKCVWRRHKHPRCWRNRDCKTQVKNARAVCWRGQCEVSCRRGYHYTKGACWKNDNKCKGHYGDACYPVQDGYSTCKDGKCSYHCATYLGYTLFTNKWKTAFRCINLESDPNNCGERGNVCPAGYNGKGWPYCYIGECQLDCHGYAHKYTQDGQPYCTDA